ncbi:MAG TPA: hypothetical protein VJO99_15510 [Burkholderiaceae bacterium]|nr:hypothetical protein [Burkholderiaceae bacterium]
MSHARIVGDWVHAHERDHDDVRVFVDARQPLPPSRGRRRLSLHTDGTFVDQQPGADDRSSASSGTYQFDGGRLVLHQQGGNAATIVYEAVVAADGSCLDLKRSR